MQDSKNRRTVDKNDKISHETSVSAKNNAALAELFDRIVTRRELSTAQGKKPAHRLRASGEQKHKRLHAGHKWKANHGGARVRRRRCRAE